MTMDITRTFNIDGKFTPEQAKWYNVDLESQKATIAMLKPGKDPKRMVKALSVRVGLSVTLFLILMASYYFGLIQGRL